MNALQLIAHSIPLDDTDRPVMDAETIEGVCAVTGETGPCIPRKLLLTNSFTTGDILRAPGSDLVSVDAYMALKYKWERMSSWVCDGGTFTCLDRVGVRNAALGETPTSPWIGYATTSYKKHGSLLTPVNTGKRRQWVFETRLVDLTDMARTMEIWERLNIELRRGFGRSILETLDCPVYVMRKVGLREWLSFHEWARDKLRSSLYSFMCYLLPSQEELKEEAKLAHSVGGVE